MDTLLWFAIWLTLNIFALTSNIRYLQTERERYRRLVQAHNQLYRLWEQGDRTLDALSQNFEDSARHIESRERVMQQKLAARAEQLIVMRTARGRNGSFEVARLFITETDMLFLRGKPGLWGSFAEAVKDVSEKWFYQAVAGGIA